MTADDHDRLDASPGDRDDRERRRLLEAFTGIPATTGNRVTVLRDGEEIFPAMLEAIAAAERTIDFMTYVYWRGDISRRFAEALAERARAGVRVRVLLDSFGARKMDRRSRQLLRDAGAVLARFRPYATIRLWELNMRTHRRVLVCDEQVAFTGGVGIGQEWVDDRDDGGTAAWRDTHFRVEGPAVDGVHAAFYTDWIETGHPVIDETDRFPPREPVGDSEVQVLRASSQLGWNAMAITLQGLLELADEQVRITSAYFRPPGALRRAMLAAIERGVRIDVLTPGPHAEPQVGRWGAEYHYDELLAGGVRIWRYQPAMHHGKVVTVDGAVALVGTTNFDARSLAMNEQVGLLLHDREVVGTLDRHFAEDLEHSRPVDPAEWRDRGLVQRGLELTGHLLTYPLRGAGVGRS